MSSKELCITVHPSQVLARVSPHLAGACIEDVNHEIYGGIHCQMIFGENFEEEPMEIHQALNSGFAGLEGTVSCIAEREHLKDAPEIRSWQPVRTGTARGRLRATQQVARRGQRSQLIEFLGGDGAVGIENRGLNRCGMHFEAGKPYDGLLVVMASITDTPEGGLLEFRVAMESADGDTVYAEQRLAAPANRAWHTVPFSLTPNATADGGRFAITLHAPGRMWVDYALLQPGPWGRFGATVARRDIADALVRQGLTVMRCGGCMINTDWRHEQQCPGSGYRWKKMLGPRQDRPPYRGTFYCYASNGFGVIDFIQLCETAGFLCVPTLAPAESPEDVADLLEYANGGAETAWGARRIADGHPAPYRLRYVQIGNEDNTPGFMSNLLPILRAMAARDPSVTPILGAGLWAGDGLIDWRKAEYIRAVVNAVRGMRVLWDVHVGGDDWVQHAHMAEGFMARARRLIDETDPENQIGLCVLEENGGLHNMQRALGHAHMIMSFERQGLVQIDTPANCLQAWKQNDNGWDQGQVFYTPSQVWGMPPYYAQQMLARHYLPVCISAEIDGNNTLFDVTATRDEGDTVRCVKLLNLGEAPAASTIIFDDGWQGSAAEVTVLSGPLEGENTPEETERIASVKGVGTWTEAGFRFDMPSYGFAAVIFRR